MYCYHITLHSPMGPKEGLLTLPPEGRGVAEVALLGRRSRLEVRPAGEGEVLLDGCLESIMGEIAFAVSLPLRTPGFDALARTGRGAMRLTGERMEGSYEG